MVFDGSTNSDWVSSGETNWLQIDLGTTQWIGRYVVKHAGGYESWGAQSLNTRDFKLQVSNDGSTWTDVDSVTGNTANITDRNVSASGRYVRLYITNPQTETTYRGARIYEFGVWANSSTNMALNKSVTMLNGTFGYGALANVVDGNVSTYLQSNTNVPWDLQVDLGSLRYVSKVVFAPDAINYASQYKIKSSTDGTNWTIVATESSGGVQQKTYSSAGFTARYLLMDVTATVGGGSTWGHAVREFEVWGS